MTFDTILKRLEEAETITIFRHTHPDCDALGSQFALKNWLLENHPKKQVYALGMDHSDQGDFPSSDTVMDELIQSSVAVILDTANQERIDDQRYRLAKTIIKIDHHPDREPYGDLSYVNEDAAAVCEILCELFEAMEPERCVSAKTASYLYCGLLTDTLCFRTANTTAKTLSAAAYLANKDIPIPELNRMLFDQSLHEYQFANYLRSKIQFQDGIAAVYVTRDDLQQWNMTGSQARNFIDEFGHVNEYLVWCMFTQHRDPSDDRYDGSLRSKRVAVNGIASEYNGGGHRNASGVKNLTTADIGNLLHALHMEIDSEPDQTVS